MYIKVIIPIVLLLIASSCQFPTNFEVSTTPVAPETQTIKVASQAKVDALRIHFGAGELTVDGGATDLLEGTATYNLPILKPTVEIRDGSVTLSQGREWHPPAQSTGPIINQWVLKIGSQALDLQINAGAYNGRYDFGNTRLVNLAIADGACESTVDFSTPNATEMGVFSYKTGASNINILNLGNANTQKFIFESGAGNYTIDLAGNWETNAEINIHSGLSNITLAIPQGLNVNLTAESGLTNINIPDSWEQRGNDFSQKGSGPLVTIKVTMGMGNLQIIQ